MAFKQEINFELDPDEEYDKFCGKVFLTTKRNIILHCTLCESKYLGFESYLNHINLKHLTIPNESLEEVYLDSEDDEEFLQTHEEEVPIEQLQKNASANVQKSKPKSKNILNTTDDRNRKSSVAKVKRKVAPENLPVISEVEDRSRRIQIVSSEKGVFACPHCPLRFPLEYSLRAHVKEHDENRSFKCNICNVQCKSNSLLRTHMRRHEKHKPHKCTECERSFVNLSELQYHMRNHNGEKPFQCEYCGMRYAYRSTLKMHRKRHHTFQKDYICPICNQAFYTSRFLRDHMTKHTKEPSYECSKCGKKFNTSSCFGRHRRQHRTREEAEKEKTEIATEEPFVNIIN